MAVGDILGTVMVSILLESRMLMFFNSNVVVLW